MAEHTPTLPDVAPHHWDSPEGREMAAEYSTLLRNQLGHSALSDFALANAVFLVGRDDLRLINFQTSAKERIRWLSVQLVIAKALNDDLVTALEAIIESADAPHAHRGARATDHDYSLPWEDYTEIPDDDLNNARAALARAKGGEG